jgi:hypothetical protein
MAGVEAAKQLAGGGPRPLRKQRTGDVLIPSTPRMIGVGVGAEGGAGERRCREVEDGVEMRAGVGGLQRPRRKHRSRLRFQVKPKVPQSSQPRTIRQTTTRTLPRLPPRAPTRTLILRTTRKSGNLNSQASPRQPNHPLNQSVASLQRRGNANSATSVVLPIL